jgi:hypothetical protein
VLSGRQNDVGYYHVMPLGTPIPDWVKISHRRFSLMFCFAIVSVVVSFEDPFVISDYSLDIGHLVLIWRKMSSEGN